MGPAGSGWFAGSFRHPKIEASLSLNRVFNIRLIMLRQRTVLATAHNSVLCFFCDIIIAIGLNKKSTETGAKPLQQARLCHGTGARGSCNDVIQHRGQIRMQINTLCHSECILIAEIGVMAFSAIIILALYVLMYAQARWIAG